ncbi:MAG TPA: hypothetical protein PKA41_08575 [Verrucomicrobiota bacterium]|nr:hypothetical protein [Verrucomicrobiota bacterium]
MTLNRHRLTCLAGFALLAVLATLLAGCKTPKIDWNSRVGNYTYDQAVLELGPPDKHATLSDGVIVAEWLARRGYTQAYVSPAYYPGYYGPYYGPVFGPVVEITTPSLFLRLIFAPDQRLQAWKTYYN